MDAPNVEAGANGSWFGRRRRRLGFRARDAFAVLPDAVVQPGLRGTPSLVFVKRTRVLRRLHRRRPGGGAEGEG